MKLTTLLLFCSITAFAQNLSFTPTHPLPGETITIEYTPKTIQEEGIQIVAYTFESIPTQLSQVQELTWTKAGNQYTAKCATNKEIKALLIRVLPADATEGKATSGEGYAVSFYEPDRQTIRQGAIYAQGIMYGYYGNREGLRKSEERADSLFKTSFAIHPNLKANAKHYELYLYHKIEYQWKIGRILAEHWTREVLSESSPPAADIYACLNLMYHLDRIQPNYQFKKMSAKLLKLGAKRYPYELFSSIIIHNKLIREVSLKKRRSYLKKLKALQQEGAKNQNYIDSGLSNLAVYTFLQTSKDIGDLTKQIDSKKNLLNTNTMLAVFSGGRADEPKGRRLEEGLSHNEKVIDILQIEQETASLKTNTTTKRWYQQSIEKQLNQAHQSQGLIFFKLGETEKALAIQKELCTKTRFENTYYVERYCQYLEAVEGEQAALKALLRIANNNITSEELERQMQRLFLVQGGTASEFAAKMEEIHLAANKKMVNDLTEKMTQIPAPAFTLKNLSGEEISSDDLWGKVVVLDFWASWCGPCKAAFPAMQHLVDIYADRDDVIFLFIDTFERGKDKTTIAAANTVSAGYRFNVLLDTKSQMANDFGVSSIPAKIVIDKNGNICFNSVGFDGERKTLSELSLMIEMASQL